MSVRRPCHVLRLMSVSDLEVVRNVVILRPGFTKERIGLLIGRGRRMVFETVARRRRLILGVGRHLEILKGIADDWES